MALPRDYLALLLRLAEAEGVYERVTGRPFHLVGGGAVAILTQGAFMSGDLDVLAENDEALDAALRSANFVRDERIGRFRLGWVHPAHAGYGVESVSGDYFDGRGDRSRAVRVTLEPGKSLVLPAPEDLIADRLGQHAVASASDPSRLEQARALAALAVALDREYLRRRIIEDGGDPAALEVT